MGERDRLLGGVPGPSGARHGAELVRFLETMPAAFCLLDTQWRFRYVNAEAERLMNRRRDDIVGESLWESFPHLSGSLIEETYRAAVATGRPMTFETEHRGARAGWVEVRVWPGPDGLAVYVLDATDRRDAEETAHRATARTALLAQVRAELTGELDTESALGRLARLVVPVLTDGCIVTVVDRDGRPRDVGSWHADPARRPLMQRYTLVRLDSLPSTSPVAQALHAGTPLTQPVDAVLRLMRPGPSRDLLVALHPATAVVLPLTAEGRTVGVLTLYLDAGRTLSEEDLETARQVAAEAGRAVARVHRQSQQAQLAEALQRSLLTDPPAMGEAEIVVRYVPAAEAARVGGDWYDAFPLRDGTPVLVIGDVVGHDTAAAAAMGQLRALLRGIAHYSGAGPAEVLRGLDEAIADMHTDTLATAAVARLEPSGAGDGSSRLRWANAGHPPPIVVAPDGNATVLGGPIGDLMLGVDCTTERPESLVDVTPDSTVLLYTDGLIERRGSTLDDGISRLVAQLGALAGRPLEELCDALLEEMLQGTPQDDVAIVAVRLSSSGPRHPGGSVSGLRHG
ncbi:MAG: putative sensor protein [Blastococcus sp.]|nr:putative sensor protein [Blastococcus sp.]